MFEKWKSKAVWLAGAAVIAGCTVGPNYHPPKVAMPTGYSRPATTAPATQPANAEPPLNRWWTVFHDPELDSLIERAVRSNRDLKQALSRVREARAQRGVVAAGLFPEVNADAGYQRARGSKNVELPLGGGGGSESGNAAASGAGGGGTGNQVRPAQVSAASGGAGVGRGSSNVPPLSPLGEGGLPGVTTSIYQAGFDASWEIDIFGGTRREIEAAKANIAAAEEDRRAVLVTLMAEVAADYIRLRGVQARLEIARHNLDAQREDLAIIRARFQTGLATELDVAQQASLVDTTAATLAPIESMTHDLMHILAFALAQDPDSLDDELTAAPLPAAPPPSIPLGVPSDLLRRRPDLRRAERQLAAANAEIGAATAELFPKFSLTGQLGLDSSKLEKLPEWASGYFAISPTVTWPILDWGRIRSNIKVRNEIERQALLAYENAVAQALKDVEDAIVHYESEQVHRISLTGAVTHSQQALTVARQEYSKGLVDQVTVLDAQRSLLSAQDALAQSDTAVRTDLVALYKALGGGW